MMKITLFTLLAAIATCSMAERDKRSPGGAGWQSSSYDDSPTITAARSSGWNSGYGSGFGRSVGRSSNGWGNSNSGFGGRSRSSWGASGGYGNGFSSRSSGNGWGNQNNNLGWDNEGYDSGSNFRSIGWQASW